MPPHSLLLFILLLIFLSFSQSKAATQKNGVQSHCESPRDRKFCESLRAGRIQYAFQIALKRSIAEAEKVRGFIPSKSDRRSMDAKQSQGIEDCSFLYGLTVDYLKECLSKMTNSTYKLERKKAMSIQSYLSAALTNQVTCGDSLKEANVSLRKFSFTDHMSNVSRSISNCLALENKFWIGRMDPVHNRCLLSHDGRQVSRVDDDFLSQYGPLDGGFPMWVSRADRRLLLQNASGVNLTGNVVTVAQNGSRNYSTITDAINAAQNKSSNRTVIYVTAGVYEEYVSVPINKNNIMLVGDGIDVTVITGNRSVRDNSTTFNSATFATVGKGFLTRDITFENTAGAVKHQAVALRLGSDLSAFYRFSIKGYQDTLYAHLLRQLYRECDIYGTVDFIFGNAAVVFQKCNLLARKPMVNQQNLYTTQGRTDPNQNTRTSIQNCNVTAADDLVPVMKYFPTYLGRPWKEYSRTVYMQSYLDRLIWPIGWLEWSGDFALSTLYYGEYNNKGPGANTSEHVRWSSYHVMNISAAKTFTVSSFISGDKWLAATSVPYDGGLL